LSADNSTADNSTADNLSANQLVRRQLAHYGNSFVLFGPDLFLSGLF
jgi:hypothetical protein